MSKLTGRQIFELLSDVNEGLILESVDPALLTAGGALATAGAAGGTYLGGASGSGTVTATASAAKTGLGAWLAKGGWIAVVAAFAVTVGLAVGGFLLLDGFEWPTLPDVTEESSEELPSDTSEGVEDTTEREPQPPVEVENFEDETVLSLFSAEQGTLSVNGAGDLVVDAVWGEGDVGFSTLCWATRLWWASAAALTASGM